MAPTENFKTPFTAKHQQKNHQEELPLMCSYMTTTKKNKLQEYINPLQVPPNSLTYLLNIFLQVNCILTVYMIPIVSVNFQYPFKAVLNMAVHPTYPAKTVISIIISNPIVNYVKNFGSKNLM